jgi:hypothetical protein
MIHRLHIVLATFLRTPMPCYIWSGKATAGRESLHWKTDQSHYIQNKFQSLYSFHTCKQGPFNVITTLLVCVWQIMIKISKVYTHIYKTSNKTKCDCSNCGRSGGVIGYTLHDPFLKYYLFFCFYKNIPMFPSMEEFKTFISWSLQKQYNCICND